MPKFNLLVITMASLLLFGCCPTCKKAKIRVVPVQEKTKEKAKKLGKARGETRKTSLSTERVMKTAGYADITAEKLAEKVKKGEKFVLLDVRTPEEYAEGHIKDAIFIPYTEIPSKYKKLGCQCHQIIVYSKNGYQSAIASKVLVELGFEGVENLLGGIEAWKASGGKIVK